MVTTETADNVLKSYYLDAIAESLNKNVSPFFAAIRHTTSDVWGKDVRKTVRIGVNGGIGAGTETGELPTAHSNKYAVIVSNLKNLYGSIEISDKALRASASGEGAFVNLLNDEMNSLIESASFNFGRMLFGDGSGTLAYMKTASNTTYTLNFVHNLVEGMVVDIYDTSDNLVAAGRIVEKVDRVNKTVTLSGDALTNVLDHALVIQGSKGLELTGLGAIFSEQKTLYGLDRTKNNWLYGFKRYSFGEMTEEKLQTIIDAVEEQSGSKINFIVCSWGVRRALAKALSAYRRLEPMMLEGGSQAVSFNGIPVVAERFCPKGTMYLLNTNDFALHQLCDWQWLEGEDGKVLKQMPGKPIYTATLVKYAELICYRPCGQALIGGITEV